MCFCIDLPRHLPKNSVPRAGIKNPVDALYDGGLRKPRIPPLSRLRGERSEGGAAEKIRILRKS